MQFWLSMLLLACLGLPPAVASQQSHGFSFDDAVSLDGGTQLPLRVLNEVLRRHSPWQVVALYARSGPGHQDELLQGLQPFVIDIVWLQQQSGEQVSEWWYDAFAQSLPDDAQRALLGSRMTRIARIFAAGVGHGQRTRISYLPDAGLRFHHQDDVPVAVIGLDMAKLMIALWPELALPPVEAAD